MMTSNPDQVIRLIISDIRLGTRSTSTSALLQSRSRSTETVNFTQDSGTETDPPKSVVTNRKKRRTMWCLVALAAALALGSFLILYGIVPAFPPAHNNTSPPCLTTQVTEESPRPSPTGSSNNAGE
ncbi:uncharacterized protein LOC135392248 [Ornithodoros turicata]|uniref:uncharacterized protein LOC135392248 n=1 Tax=Ornithodoros turicata TaxID=34597 RepID=UPI003139F570